MIYISCPNWAPYEHPEDDYHPDLLINCKKCKRPFAGYSPYPGGPFIVHPEPDELSYHKSKLAAFRHILQLTIRHARRECWA